MINYSYIMKNRFLFILIVLINVLSLNAQNSCGMLSPHEGGGIYWEVIVNKNNVPVYRDNDCTIKVSNKTLSFKSKFNVCNEGANRSSLKLEIGSDKYWVKKEDLLLTSRSLTTTSGIAVKASVVSYFGGDTPDGTYYDNPTNDYGPKKNIGSVMWYDFYFVYDTYPKSKNKDVGNSQYVLLGKKYKYTAGASSEGSQSPNKIIFGWFKTRDLLIWNTRLAFEPNLSPSSKREKAHNKTYASIWKVKSDAVSYSENSSSRKILISNDKKLVENNITLQHSDYRFPALEKSTQNGKIAYRIAFAGNLYGQRRFSEELKEAENIKNIEILFVVDGTKTMIEPLKSIPKGISDAISNISRNFGKDYSLTWKLAVFRNSKDHAVNQGYYYYGETKNVNKLRSWIRSIRGKSTSNLLPEDMFYGTQLALEEAFTGKKESVRIVFLISDVKGEERKRERATPTYLGRSLKQKKAHFFALNIGTEYANEFKLQMQKTIQEANNSTETFVLERGSGFKKYSLRQKSGYTRLYLKLNSTAYIKDIVDNAIRQIVTNIDNEYQSVRYGVDSIPPPPSNQQTPKNGKFKFDFKMDFSEEFQKLDFSNKAIKVSLTNGWVVNEHHNLNEAPFRPVILLSQEECYILSNLTNALVDQINTPRPHEAIEKYLGGLSKAHTGEFSLVDDLKNSIKRVGGEVPLVSKLLDAYLKGTLNDIIPVDDARKLNDFRIDLSDKSDKIKGIFSEMVNERDKVFIIGEERYRWVQLSDLP